MSFLLGGFRFREQIHNSTVTQMSACLLSLAVTSLLLPTAFHASFNDSATADFRVLQVSRGTSVILLLVYILYLLFQLNSHAYMYESTPQHVIERESVPWETSSSSSSDSSSDDSDSSSNAASRLKRKIKGKMSRKQSTSTVENPVLGATQEGGGKVIEPTPESLASSGAGGGGRRQRAPRFAARISSSQFSSTTAWREADEMAADGAKKEKKKHKRHHRKHRRAEGTGEELMQTQSAPHRRVDFVLASDLEAQQTNTPAKASSSSPSDRMSSQLHRTIL